jgi:hypothetical protein
MGNSNSKKAKQLGKPFGTASNKLRKEILFHYVKLANHNFCFQCKEEIVNINEFSIDHKVPYLDSHDPKLLFSDINNIAFSHLSCNIKASRRKLSDHGSVSFYARGCRCELCKKAKNDKQRKYRKNKKLKANVE